MAKIAIIGAGNVGGTTAYLLTTQNLADVALIDINEKLSKGKALDINQALIALNIERNVIAGSDYSLAKDSDLVVITSGSARKPGMTRQELEEVNTKVLKEVCENLKKVCPQAIFVVVTNPVEKMTQIAYEILKTKDNDVLGLSGVLDTARYKYYLREKFGNKKVEALVLGQHNQNMVPLLSQTKVDEKEVSEVEDVIQQTKEGGATIVNLLGTSAYFAPAAAILQIAKAVLNDEKATLPVVTKAKGEYNLTEKFIGLPAVIGKKGVEKIVELDLKEKELENLTKSS